MTIREAISRVKKELKEVNADSRLPNKFVYSKLSSRGVTLVQRESDNLKLGKLQDLYQTLSCVTFTQVPAIDPICNLNLNLSLYRTCNKLPPLFSDQNGVIITSIRSLDRFGKQMSFQSLNHIINAKANTSSSRYDKSIYVFYEDGYLYSTSEVRGKVTGYFTEDVRFYKDCECPTESTDCLRFLDTKWFVPKRLEDTIITMTVQELANGYKRLPEQLIIDKNTTT